MIRGNLIGLDSTGSIPLGNSNNGVEVDYGSGTVVGGPKIGDGNVISANQAGVFLQNSALGVAIEGNEIGTDARGFKAVGNNYDGVVLSGLDNTVGGTAAGDGNLISGNGRDGISDGVYASSVGNNLIEGNLIGLDSTGTVAIPNGQDGIDLGTIGDVVGGSTAASRNVISGNRDFGIDIENQSNLTLVEGNDIGTDPTGTQPLGNGSDGVHIQDNAASNTVGGSASKDGNTIAFNGATGVSVNDNATSNPILTNSIFSNSGQGIVLSGDGNNLQVAPVLTSAISTNSGTTVKGTLTASPNTKYQIQFYANPTADPSGYGQGMTFLITKTVTTNGSGVASFSFVIKTALTAGEVVSATATDPSGNTSQFSNDVTVTGGTSSVMTRFTAANAVASPSTTAIDLVLGALPTLSGMQDNTIWTDLAMGHLQSRDHRPGY